MDRLTYDQLEWFETTKRADGIDHHTCIFGQDPTSNRMLVLQFFSKSTMNARKVWSALKLNPWSSRLPTLYESTHVVNLATASTLPSLLKSLKEDEFELIPIHASNRRTNQLAVVQSRFSNYIPLSLMIDIYQQAHLQCCILFQLMYTLSRINMPIDPHFTLNDIHLRTSENKRGVLYTYAYEMENKGTVIVRFKMPYMVHFDITIVQSLLHQHAPASSFFQNQQMKDLIANTAALLQIDPSNLSLREWIIELSKWFNHTHLWYNDPLPIERVVHVSSDGVKMQWMDEALSSTNPNAVGYGNALYPMNMSFYRTMRYMQVMQEQRETLYQQWKRVFPLLTGTQDDTGWAMIVDQRFMGIETTLSNDVREANRFEIPISSLSSMMMSIVTKYCDMKGSYTTDRNSWVYHMRNTADWLDVVWRWTDVLEKDYHYLATVFPSVLARQPMLTEAWNDLKRSWNADREMIQLRALKLFVYIQKMPLFNVHRSPSMHQTKSLDNGPPVANHASNQNTGQRSNIIQFRSP